MPLLLLLGESESSLRWPDSGEKTGFDVRRCTSVGDLWSAAMRTPGSVAVVDWRRIGGLLSEEHRHSLSMLDKAVPLIVLVDQALGTRVRAEDLGVSAVLAKPTARQDLLATLAAVAATHKARLVTAQA